jgi:hypothetical protein
MVPALTPIVDIMKMHTIVDFPQCGPTLGSCLEKWALISGKLSSSGLNIPQES